MAAAGARVWRPARADPVRTRAGLGNRPPGRARGPARPRSPGRVTDDARLAPFAPRPAEQLSARTHPPPAPADHRGSARLRARRAGQDRSTARADPDRLRRRLDVSA